MEDLEAFRGDPRRRQVVNPGYPPGFDPQQEQEDVQPAARPVGRFTARQTGWDHFNGKLKPGGMVQWTINGSPVSADEVPPEAKKGFEVGLRKHGYRGPITHITQTYAPMGDDSGAQAPAPRPAPRQAVPRTRGGQPAPQALPADPIPLEPLPEPSAPRASEPRTPSPAPAPEAEPPTEFEQEETPPMVSDPMLVRNRARRV